MPLHPAYAQVSALLASVFILIAGNGLSNTLIPLSATAAHFPPLSIGVIASSYFVGMFVGCIAAPRIIARAGHIRAFSAFVAIATDPHVQEIGVHRAAGLESQWLIAATAE